LLDVAAEVPRPRTRWTCQRTNLNSSEPADD
jgi:hypothetical protein